MSMHINCFFNTLKRKCNAFFVIKLLRNFHIKVIYNQGSGPTYKMLTYSGSPRGKPPGIGMMGNCLEVHHRWIPICRAQITQIDLVPAEMVYHW